MSQVLVVDDEADIRALIQEILSDEGYGVTVAANAEEARSARGEDRFDSDPARHLDAGYGWHHLAARVVGQRRSQLPGRGHVRTRDGRYRGRGDPPRCAHDFVEKPLSLAKLLRTVEGALESAGKQGSAARAWLPSPLAPVGRSALMQDLREKVQQYARHDAAVIAERRTRDGPRCVRALHALAEPACR